MFFCRYSYRCLLLFICIVISFFSATQGWAVDIRSISPSGSTPSTPFNRVQRGSSPVNNIALKADLLLAPRSVACNKKSVAAGQMVEVTAQVQNLDVEIRNRVRVRFSCKAQKKDVFINLRPRQKKQVSAKLTMMGPAGRKTILVEVNPLHRELAERNYKNNQGSTKILVTEKGALEFAPPTSGISVKQPAKPGLKLKQNENFPVITGVHPNQLLAGKEYSLKLHGNDLSVAMKLDFGLGIRVTGKLLPFDKFVLVPLVVDSKASPGKRKITLHFKGESKVQRPTITLQAVINPIKSTIVIPSPVDQQAPIEIPSPSSPPKSSITIAPKQEPLVPKLVVEKPDVIGSLILKSVLRNWL